MLIVELDIESKLLIDQPTSHKYINFFWKMVEAQAKICF